MSTVDEFLPSRTLDLESRIRAIEDWASLFSGRQSVDPSAVEATTSGTTAAGGGGGGSIGTLLGDVTGPATANTVGAAQHIPLPVPGAGDNSKGLVYRQASAAYLLRHLQFKNVTKTASYALTADDLVVLADATTGALTITLPTAVGRRDDSYGIKKTDSTANGVTIMPSLGESLDGSATPMVLTTPMQAIVIASDGSNWWIVAGWLSPVALASPGYISTLYWWMGGAGE